MKNNDLNDIQIRQHLDELIASGAIGNAHTYRQLLLYLAEKSLDGSISTPTEVEIAQDVFGKTDFSQPTDSSVRVYIHNLRKKLESYYAKTENSSDIFFYIPKGSYALKWRTVDEKAHASTALKILRGPRFRYFAAAFLIVLVGAIGYSFGANKHNSPMYTAQSQHPVWGGIRKNKIDTIIVIGDLYHYTETDTQTGHVRMVRDFSINSDQSVEALKQSTNTSTVKIDISPLKYFGKGTVFSLPFLTKELQGHTRITLKMSSQLTADDIRKNNIVYIGLFKSLGTLQDIYKGTPFLLSDNYEYLTDMRDQQNYTVEGDADKTHTDYGIYTQHKTANGNIIITLASFTETALLQMTEQLTSNKTTFDQESTSNNIQDMALFFSVSGYNRTNIKTNLIAQTPLDQTQIWHQAQ